MAYDWPDWAWMRFIEMVNQLIGFNNTHVATGVLAYPALPNKTVTLTNFGNNNWSIVTWTRYVRAVGDMGRLKITYQIDGGAETTLLEDPTATTWFSNTVEYERTHHISPPLTGDTIVVGVYLKVGAAGDIAETEKFELFGTVRERISYE